jgi:hypothetical protein
MLALLLTSLPASLILNGCQNQNEENPTPIVEPESDLRKEDYYNRYPVQIYIDNDFDEYNKYLTIQSLEELDEALWGVTFNYHDWDGESIDYDLYYSYIKIKYDENGATTIRAYQDPNVEDKPYAYANTYKEEWAEKVNGNYINLSNFRSTVTMGSYFSISEEIGDSSSVMGWKFDNYNKYGAYNDPALIYENYGFWKFGTKYTEFRSAIEKAWKTIIKHEVSHSLGYEGNSNINCGGGDYCHSSDKDSLMYPYLIPRTNAENKITRDVFNYFYNKYPTENTDPGASKQSVQSNMTFYNNGNIQINISGSNKERVQEITKNLVDYLKNGLNITAKKEKELEIEQ